MPLCRVKPQFRMGGLTVAELMGLKPGMPCVCVPCKYLGCSAQSPEHGQAHGSHARCAACLPAAHVGAASFHTEGSRGQRGWTCFRSGTCLGCLHGRAHCCNALCCPHVLHLMHTCSVFGIGAQLLPGAERVSCSACEHCTIHGCMTTPAMKLPSCFAQTPLMTRGSQTSRQQP